jgi:cytoskeletal protein CcmA (bactofilin family)
MPDSPDRDDAAEAAAPVLLAVGAEFTGLVALAGPARVEGLLRGEVIGPGPLWIGPRANVEARIETDELNVSGTVKGEIRASRRVVLGATARVRGELYTPSLSLAEGALMEGRCATGSPPVDAPESSAATAKTSAASA